MIVQASRTRLPSAARRAAAALCVAALAAASGCCCLPCGGCLPYEASCLPAPNSYAMDMGCGDCGIPGYAVPGCDSPILADCGMPSGCECCPPMMTASACDGVGCGPCKPFPILQKLFCGWWLPRCPPAMADPYQPAYYCDSGCGAVPAVYETPAYGGEVIHEGPVYDGSPSPAYIETPMPTPAETVVPAPTPAPSEPSAALPRQWQPSGVRHVQHQVIPGSMPAVRPAAGVRQTVTKPTLRQRHAAWQPPPRW